MKAVILNSGVGSRMGELTEDKPKCLVQISDSDTILSHQLKLLVSVGIFDIVITIGPYGNIIPDYVKSNFPDLDVAYVVNEKYDTTNYIYSMFLADNYLREDIILMHGDIVMEEKVLTNLLNDTRKNLVIIDSTIELPEKDFKAKIKNNIVKEIDVNIKKDKNVFFLLPIYKLSKKSMENWMDEINKFIQRDEKSVYAENAFNSISSELELITMDIKGGFCMEVDTEEDLELAKVKINE